MTMEDLIDLALLTTGMNRPQWDFLMETMRSDAEMNRVMKGEWSGKPRDTEASIRSYYAVSDIWFVNTFNHGYSALLALAKLAQENDPPFLGFEPWQEELIGTMKPNVGHRFLDYGGGFFSDTWRLVAGGFHVTQAEVKGPVTSFLKSFLSETGLEWAASILEVDADEPVPTGVMYDGMITFETMEHVLKPVELMRHLVSHLSKNRQIIMSVSFGAPEHAPYHVASNAHLNDHDSWAKHLQSMGLERTWLAKDKHRQMWRKV